MCQSHAFSGNFPVFYLFQFDEHDGMVLFAIVFSKSETLARKKEGTDNFLRRNILNSTVQNVMAKFQEKNI